MDLGGYEGLWVEDGEDGLSFRKSKEVWGLFCLGFDVIWVGFVYLWVWV